jgi:hypothetical protein
MLPASTHLSRQFRSFCISDKAGQTVLNSDPGSFLVQHLYLVVPGLLVGVVGFD